MPIETYISVVISSVALAMLMVLLTVLAAYAMATRNRKR